MKAVRDLTAPHPRVAREWLRAGGTGVAGVPRDSTPLRKARQVSSADDPEQGKGSFPHALAPSAPACFSRFNHLNIAKADVAPHF